MKQNQIRERQQKIDKMCFACGEDNPISLGLEFNFVDENQVTASFIPREVHQGFDGIMHGGLITTLLDEAMAKVIYMKGIKGVTAEMTVRFKKKVKIGKRLRISGMINKIHGKLIFASAFLKDEDGTLYARAKAKFFKVKEMK